MILDAGDDLLGLSGTLGVFYGGERGVYLLDSIDVVVHQLAAQSVFLAD